MDTLTPIKPNSIIDRLYVIIIIFFFALMSKVVPHRYVGLLLSGNDSLIYSVSTQRCLDVNLTSITSLKNAEMAYN